jgi:hypothetical protein
MENIDPKHVENPQDAPKPIETDYAKHEQDPGPSPQAVNEEDNKGAGQMMKWIIPIIVIILFVLWFLLRK